MRIKFIQRLIDKLRKKECIDNIRITEESKYGRMIFSQDGEDALLDSFYVNQDCKGFYVDIGAFHPIRFSNTHLFYLRGWRGINIDATPGSMCEFKKIRPEDKNIEAVISDKETEIIYYIFNEPALNNFDKERTDYLISTGYTPIKEVKLKTQKINDILDKNIPEGKKIDFINIDIEGIDYEVICSLNYNKYAPKYFIIEELDYVDKDFVNYQNSKIYQFLSQKGYKVLAKTMRSVIYGHKGII